MNINKAIILHCIAVLFLCIAFLLLSPNVYAEENTGSINVIKNWEGKGEKPDSLTLYLKQGNEISAEISLSETDKEPDGSWAGSFKNIKLYDSSGDPIEYSIEEETVEGWSFSVIQKPRAQNLSIAKFSEKVTPASSSTYPLGSANLLIANKGGSYYIWSFDELDEGQKLRLLSRINAAKLQGFGKELAMDNTVFQSGAYAQFDDGVTVYQEGYQRYVNFTKENVWSLFYSADLQLQAAKDAVVKNTSTSIEDKPTESPNPSQTPDSSPSPLPGPEPDAPPQTGDKDIMFIMLTLFMSAAACVFILCKLKAKA